MIYSRLLLASLATALLGTGSAASASTLWTSAGTNSANGSQPLSAEAAFSLIGNSLTITLTNTAQLNTEKYVNSDVLTGIFFGSTALNLLPLSAIASSEVDSTGNPISCCDVGDGWAYMTFGSAHLGAMNGISAAGLGIFGLSNFGSSPTQLQGNGYGIVPATYPASLGTSISRSPLAKNSVAFTLTAPQGFALDQINNVTFRYGGSLDNTNLVAVNSSLTPEPVTLCLIGGGLLLIGMLRRRVQ